MSLLKVLQWFLITYRSNSPPPSQVWSSVSPSFHLTLQQCAQPSVHLCLPASVPWCMLSCLPGCYALPAQELLALAMSSHLWSQAHSRDLMHMKLNYTSKYGMPLIHRNHNNEGVGDHVTQWSLEETKGVLLGKDKTHGKEEGQRQGGWCQQFAYDFKLLFLRKG